MAGRNRVLTAMFLWLIVPAAAFAQATSFDVGGPAHQVAHSVDILNCCAHFAFANDNTPETLISVSGPPWSLQPFIGSEYGSAAASSSTHYATVSSSGVSLAATISGHASPGIGPGFALRAFAGQGGTYYSFTLDRPNYVELHATVGRGRLSVNDFGLSFSLRAGSSAGPAMPGFLFDANSNSNDALANVKFDTGPVLLPAGSYVLIAAVSGDANAYATNSTQSFLINLTLSLLIHEQPESDPVGALDCVDGGVTITPPGAVAQTVADGAPIRIGDTIATAPAGRACIQLVDGTRLLLSEDTAITVDAYVYDPFNGEGTARYSYLRGLFMYISGLVAHQPKSDVQLNTEFGAIGIRGTEFIGKAGASPGTQEVYLNEGTLAVTPWGTSITSVVNAQATIVFGRSAVNAGPFSQQTYASLRNEIVPLDHIAIAPTSATIAAGDSQAYTAEAFDLLGGSRGDVTNATAFSIAPDGSCLGATCTASVPGSHTVTADYAGKTAQATVTVTGTTGYSFQGFFAPVDNAPVFNTVKAGSGVPVKFSLNGNQGLNVLAAGYPASQSMTCDATAALDAIEETVVAGSSSLTYDAAAGQYVYVWKTDKAWSNTCRQLNVRLSDGTSHVALFRFTK